MRTKNNHKIFANGDNFLSLKTSIIPNIAIINSEISINADLLKICNNILLVKLTFCYITKEFPK